MYLARVAAVKGGLPVETPAFTVNRLCGSGLQAIVSAAQAIRLDDGDVAVAGGAESMSRAQYWLPGMRWGQRMGDGSTVDAMVGALTDPFDGCDMGITAENVAKDFDVSRAEQDALAAESHRRAAAAIEAGYFAEQIVPVEVPGRKGAVRFETDEHVRPGVTVADLAKLRRHSPKDGSVTAGNACGSTTRQRRWCSPTLGTPSGRAGRPRTARGLQPRRGGATDHGHGSSACSPLRAGAGRSQDRRHRPLRSE